MNLQTIVSELLDGEYIIKSPQGFFAFTNKFYKDFNGEDVGVSKVESVKTRKTTISINEKLDDLKTSYMDFILACNIPRRGRTSTLELYDLNQYSETGKKAFGKILARVAKGEIDYDLLVKTTQLYYKSPGAKQKIGNFISDGTWETPYASMVANINNNTLKGHIQSTLENDKTGTSRFRIPGSSANGQSQSPNRIGNGRPELRSPNQSSKA